MVDHAPTVETTSRQQVSGEGRQRTRRWPTAAQLRDVVVREPDPVALYVGRFPASLRWREDLETFAVRIRGRDRDGNPSTLWVGTEAGQYPTVEGLLQAVEARGQHINQASRRQALAYQRNAHRRFGSPRFSFERHDGNYRLRLLTPHGKAFEIRPASKRDDRSRRFGPPVALNQISGGDHQEVALELARLLLEVTDSTARTDEQLLDDAKELAVEIQQWGRSFSIPASDVTRWTQSRQPIRTTPAQPVSATNQTTPASSVSALTVTRETTTRLGGRTVKLTFHRASNDSNTPPNLDRRHGERPTREPPSKAPAATL